MVARYMCNLGRFDSYNTKLMFTYYALGLVNPQCTAFIGSGVVVHVPAFFEELENLQKKGK